MKLVSVESPYGTNPDGSRASLEQLALNVDYVRACMAYCLAIGAAPFASHALYTQPSVLEDSIPEERRRGMEAGFAWQARADSVVVFTDLGITSGMAAGIERARLGGLPVVFRSLGPPWLLFKHQASISLVVDTSDESPRVLTVWSRRCKRWMLPGGRVEKDEMVGAAQSRELEEETGLMTSSARLVFRGPHGLPVLSDRATVVNIFEVEAQGEPREMEAGCTVAWQTVAKLSADGAPQSINASVIPALVDAVVRRQTDDL
jgi:ADP-ribose pyrophosphatase YjhB (NUDIX family)